MARSVSIGGSASARGKRPRIPSTVADRVMARARRRCCICFHLEGDLSVKELQIAHLDRNRANNAPRNLVGLCLPHHDAYDSRRGLTRNYSAGEVRIYRDQLDAVFAKREESVVMRAIIEGGNAQLSSANILGRVVDAYDRALDGMEKHQRANGIALKHLARVALEEEGDFPAAAEALLSVVRLASSQGQGDSATTGLDESFASATLFTAARDILLKTAAVDLIAAYDMSRRLRLNALVGDLPVVALDNYSAAPSKSFDAVVSILRAVCVNPEAATLGLARQIAYELMALVVGYGVILVGRGTELPMPPGKIWVRIDGSRWVPDGESTTTLQFTQACHALATIPEDLATAEPVFSYMHPVHFQVGGRLILTSPHIPQVVKSWAPLPRWAIVPVSLAAGEDAARGNKLLAEANRVGAEVEQAVRSFVAKERELIRTGIEMPIAGSGGAVSVRADARP
jgi:hypothetical protein